MFALAFHGVRKLEFFSRVTVSARIIGKIYVLSWPF